MRNPTRKPKSPKGYRPVWVKGYSYKRLVGRKRTVHGTYKKIYRRVEVPSHWSVVKTKTAPEVRRREVRRVKKITVTGWERARVYEERYRREYDLASADPIYRFSREKDVVKVGGDLSGLVWDHPIRSNVGGNFDTGRIWYIAHHDTQSENYLYVRTFQPGFLMGSIGVAAEEKGKWEAAVLAEYEGKEYMAVERFVAWTVFDSTERMGKNLHKGDAWKKSDTKEKAFATKWKWLLKKPRVIKSRSGEARVVTREVRRELTPWEAKKVIKELGGGRKIGLTVRKGESIRDAFRRLTPSDKRYYRRKLARAVEVLEERWRQERRGEQ